MVAATTDESISERMAALKQAGRYGLLHRTMCVKCQLFLLKLGSLKVKVRRSAPRLALSSELELVR